MGLGDEIMASAQARHVKQVTGLKASFGEYEKTWKENPNIGQTGFPVKNMTGDRPYLLGQTPERCIFNPNFHAVPGDMYITTREWKEARELTRKLRDYVIVEPRTKDMFSKGNKDWGWPNWQALVNRLENVVQLVPTKAEKTLQGVKVLETKTFRVACAVLKNAKMFIGTDGGLHHAAAAYYYQDGKNIGQGPPAIVIWGGFSHPMHLGYRNHFNIRADDSDPCGSKIKCDHCRAMMKKVTVDQVYEAYLSLRG